MKKFLSAILALLLLASCFTFVGCDEEEVIELNVYNCEDYISQDDGDGSADLISMFEEHCKEKYGLNVKVNYSTFGTLENMYNELQLTKEKEGDSFKYAYDLVCPSDYMIQKLIAEDMLEKYDYTIEKGQLGYVNDYYDNASQFIIDLFDRYNWRDYATCYMWGTMGYVYNPEVLESKEGYVEGDERHWDFIWKDYTNNLGTIKDSIRDTYSLALGYVYNEELTALREKYEAGNLTKDEYADTIVSIFNRTDVETVKKVQDALTVLKSNIYGFEVDSGKKDMATGKIAINFAWSGDAVYTLDLAEEDGTELYYAVPEEGSNVWFDGWVMPKGANVPLAQEFINFLAQPENAQANMNYIGYTSPIGGDFMYENCVDWYGTFIMLECEEGEHTYSDGEKYYYDEYVGNIDEDVLNEFKNEGGTYNFIYPEYGDDGEVVDIYEEEGVTLYYNDLNYFFTNACIEESEYDDYIVITDVIDRQCSTQYPTEEIVNRCAIMKYFNNEEMKRLNDMWDEVKVSKVPSWLMIVIVIILVLGVVAGFITLALKKKGVSFNIKFKNKNLTLISREILK